MTAATSDFPHADAEGDPLSIGAAGPPCAALLARAYEPEPTPFVGPYLGVVGGVLCALVGAFLLLAPFAFDYRRGTAGVPRAAVVDLATGGAVLLFGLLTAGLFGVTLVRRLRWPDPAADEEEAEAQWAEEFDLGDEELLDDEEDFLAGEQAAGPVFAEPTGGSIPLWTPEPEPPRHKPVTDPSDALRDLLTPLVAALAADLRARDQGSGLDPDTEREKD